MTKISNQYSLTNVLFADAVNGRVGIGTASPTVPLDVVGAGKFSGALTGTSATFSSSVQATTFSSVNSTPQMDFVLSTNTAYKHSIVASNFASSPASSNILDFRVANGANSQVTVMNLTGAGNVGIGTSSPLNATGYTSISLNNATNGGIIDYQQNGTSVMRVGNNGTTVAFIETRTATPLTISTNDTERLRITPGGGTEVRSGNTLSIYRPDNTRALQLTTDNNACYIDAYESTSEPLQIRSNGSSGRIQFHTNFSERARINSAGDFLVATTSPVFDSAGRGCITIGGSSTSILSLKPGGNAGGYVYHNGSSLSLSNNLAGGVYVTASSGGVQLNNGATSWTSSSDERLKNINSNIEDAVNKLSSLRAVNFSWKSDETQKEVLGLIAQDVEKVFPQVVDKSKLSTNIDEEQIDETEYLGVRYTELVPVLVKAIQEQQLQINELKALLNAH